MASSSLEGGRSLIFVTSWRGSFLLRSCTGSWLVAVIPVELSGLEELLDWQRVQVAVLSVAIKAGVHVIAKWPLLLDAMLVQDQGDRVALFMEPVDPYDLGDALIRH